MRIEVRVIRCIKLRVSTSFRTSLEGPSHPLIVLPDWRPFRMNIIFPNTLVDHLGRCKTLLTSPRSTSCFIAPNCTISYFVVISCGNVSFCLKKQSLSILALPKPSLAWDIIGHAFADQTSSPLMHRETFKSCYSLRCVASPAPANLTSVPPDHLPI